MMKNEPNEPEFVAATLKWCNERRAEQDLGPLDALPKGRRKDDHSCPCGAATGLWVGTDYYKDDSLSSSSRMSLQLHDLPSEVMEFVAAFDAGRLPQYDLSPDLP